MILLTWFLWLASAALLCWLMNRQAQPETTAGPVPPDPVAEEVGKWMHDWDRGRA